MQHDDDLRSEHMTKIDGQLAMAVPSSPDAIGRWTTDDQFREYEKIHGTEKALEQKRLAEEAAVCSCGVQSKEDQDALNESRRAKKLPGHLHKAGCPKLTTTPKSPVRIAPDEQIRRYTKSVD